MGTGDGRMVMAPVGLHEVKPGEGALGHRLDITWKRNILAIDWNKDFLSFFSEKRSQGDYIGIGKSLVALANWTKSDSAPEAVALKRRIFDAVIGAQTSDGYIGGHAAQRRTVRLWDVHETSHIIWGLVADYVHHGELRSLEAARRAAEYLESSLTSDAVSALRSCRERLRPQDAGLSVCVELGAIDYERAFLELYKATGEHRYMKAIDRLGLDAWNSDIILGRRDGVGGHAYAYLARCCVQLELYRMTGDERLRAQTRRAMGFLLGRGGLAINGAVGQYECWHNDQEGSGQLGETCASAYLVQLLDLLMQLDGDPWYGDIMERVIYNALFAAQSPDGRQLRYYIPFDGPRVYFDRDTFCCPNNYRWIISLLPRLTYYKADGGIAVNLYAASSLHTTIGDGVALSLYMATDYPSSGLVRIEAQPSTPCHFPLRLRIPRWCRNARVTVNGEPQQVRAGGPFAVVAREFRRGDVVEVALDMPWHLVKGFRRQYGRAAVMRGPQLFCYNPKRNPALADFPPHAIRIDPATFHPPERDDSIRPGGVACKLKCRHWEEHQMTLSEFPDPDGVATYFLSTDLSQAEEDELLDHERLTRDPDRRRISGVIPSTVDADAPEACWHGPEILDYALWTGQ